MKFLGTSEEEGFLNFLVYSLAKYNYFFCVMEKDDLRSQFCKGPSGEHNTLQAFLKTCFNDHKLYKLYLAQVSPTSHMKKNAKSKQEKHVHNYKPQCPVNLCFVFTDTQAGKKLALSGRKEEKVEPFYLFIISIKVCVDGTIQFKQ